MPIFDEDFYREQEERLRQRDSLIEQMYEDYCVTQQMLDEKQEEMKKYPLFYWRESCRKDSDQRETCKVKEKK